MMHINVNNLKKHIIYAWIYVIHININIPKKFEIEILRIKKISFHACVVNLCMVLRKKKICLLETLKVILAYQTVFKIIFPTF